MPLLTDSNYNTSAIFAFFLAGAVATSHDDRSVLYRRLDSTWNSTSAQSARLSPAWLCANISLPWQVLLATSGVCEASWTKYGSETRRAWRLGSHTTPGGTSLRHASGPFSSCETGYEARTARESLQRCCIYPPSATDNQQAGSHICTRTTSRSTSV